jgi:formylglycine-generating enzyme required for sulfatase activity
MLPILRAMGGGAMNESQSNRKDELGRDPASTAASTSTGAKSDYDLLRLIGRGAYGEVWLARDRTGAYRAVKVVFRASFDHDRPYEREFDGIRKFEPVSRSYANQVQILHVGRHDDRGCFYYIMELADDQQRGQQIDPKTYTPKTLRSELREHGRLPARECLRIGAALAGALENLHGHGLIHRDIKPGNIIFAHGVPKLADIGLVTDRDVSVSYVGTEGYIPPEGPGSAQADLFGLGKVLYEMATGRDRMDFPELPTDLEELPDREVLLELNVIIGKACARDPRRRYRSAQKMFEALARLQRGKHVRRDQLWLRRLAIAGPCLGLAAVLGLVVLGAKYLPKRSAAPKPEVNPADQAVQTNRSAAIIREALQPATPALETAEAQTKNTQREAARVRPGPKSAVVSPPVSFPRGIPLPSDMVWIRPGTFIMGSSATQQDPDPPGRPQTLVTLTQGFFVGAHEVTQGEYTPVMGTNPSAHKGDRNLPVENVSWIDATNYCARLTERERRAGRLPAGWAYRLPTEAEWEYACRAGTNTRFSYGEDPEFRQLADYAWYGHNSSGMTHSVGMKLPNAWGLYDMAGNVWEWCEDSYNGGYPGGSVTNRYGGPMGVHPIFRGGSYSYGMDPARCRSAIRGATVPTTKRKDIGFRVILAPLR